jgi:hypothetical protein
MPLNKWRVEKTVVHEFYCEAEYEEEAEHLADCEDWSDWNTCEVEASDVSELDPDDSWEEKTFREFQSKPSWFETARTVYDALKAAKKPHEKCVAVMRHLFGVLGAAIIMSGGAS